MKVKLKICCQCGLPKVIWKNYLGKRYCQNCWNHPDKEHPHEKPKTRIKPVSDKKQKLDIAYKALREVFIRTHPKCMCKIPGICQNISTEVHHAKGRIGDLYIDDRYFIATCHNCHVYLENNPLIAKELELSLTRLN